MTEEDLETAELKERIEEGVEKALEEGGGGPRWTLYLSLSTAIIAVFAAIASLESGANSNDAILEKNEAVLSEARASDQWAYYQAKGMKSSLAKTEADLAGAPTPGVATPAMHESTPYKSQQDPIVKLSPT